MYFFVIKIHKMRYLYKTNRIPNYFIKVILTNTKKVITENKNIVRLTYYSQWKKIGINLFHYCIIMCKNRNYSNKYRHF